MLEKLKKFGKGSVIAFAVLGVVAVVTTILKSRRARQSLTVDEEPESGNEATATAE